MTYKCPDCGAEFNLTPEQLQMIKTQEIVVHCPNHGKTGCKFMLVVGADADADPDDPDRTEYLMYSYEVYRR